MTRRIQSTSASGVASLLSITLLIAACGGSSEPDVVVASVEVSPTTASPQVGQTLQLSAAVKDAAGTILSGQTVAWSSSAPSVASVSASGLVTAATLGTTVVTAASGNKVGVATITVIPPPIASITVSPAIDTILIGESLQLVPTMRDASNNIVTGRTINWTSSATTIATVSSSGLVSGIGDGNVIVTASVDSRIATSTIRVFSRCSTALALPITVGQTINGSLATTDCKLTDNTYADGYALQVNVNTNVQIDLTATFDTWLILLALVNGELELVLENDDVDPDDPNDPNDSHDTNSRITFSLVGGRQYFVLANTFDPNITGDYQLKVAAAAPVIAQQQIGRSKPGKLSASKLLTAIRVP